MHGGKPVFSCLTQKGSKLETVMQAIQTVRFIEKFNTQIVQNIESQLVKPILFASEAEFESVFRGYYPRLCAYANTILTDRDEAEEIVQTMFCRLWEQRETLDITISEQAYFFRAVRNACLNQLKKTTIRESYKAQNLAQMNENPEFQPDRLTQKELSEKIRAAIAILPEQCRLIFKMSRFEELKYREIADQLGLSIKTVENQMGKALKILRGELVDFLTLCLLFYDFVFRLYG